MKKLLSVLVCFAMLMSNAAFAISPAVTEVESAEESVQTEQDSRQAEEQETAELEAEAKKSSAPGLNVFTGQKGVWNFEDATTDELKSIFGSVSALSLFEIGTDPLDSGNKVIHAATASYSGNDQSYPSFGMSLPTVLEAERPYYVTFKYRRTNDGADGTYNTDGNYMWLMKNSTGVSDIMVELKSTINDPAWGKYAAYTDFTKKGANNTAVRSLLFEVNTYQTDTSKTHYYYDDIAVIPGYKITYHLNDGTDDVYKTEYIKADLNGPEYTKYTVISDTPSSSKKFLGWSLTKNGETVDSVTIADSDIDLYAVWEKNPSDPVLRWTFDNGITGWGNWNGKNKASYEDGNLVAEYVSTGSSGAITSPTFSLDTSKAKYIKMRVRNLTSSTGIHVYFYKKGVSGISEANSFSVGFKAKTDTYQTVWKKLEGDVSTWDGVCTQFAFNFNSSAVGDKMYIDEIGFYEYAPVVEYTFDDGVQGWSSWGKFESSVADGVLTVNNKANQNQGAMNSPGNMAVPTEQARYLYLKYKNETAATDMKIYYRLTADSAYNETNIFRPKIESNMTEFGETLFDLSTLPNYTGNIVCFMLQPTHAGKVHFDTVAFYPGEPEEDPIYELTLSASAKSITEENGTVTITPNVNTNIKKAATTVSYKTNNNNAAVKKNDDGTLTLTGKINGDVTVTAVSDYDKSITADITISVSGQQDNKTAYYGMNMFMLGNSILQHGKAESIGWYGNWGMAASAEELDYAHRLQYYLSDKYGEVEFKKCNFAEFERAIATTTDFTSYFNWIKSIMDGMSSTPEIITIQMGENVTIDNRNTYKAAVIQLVKFLRENVPDANIVVCTPFWGGAGKVDGMKDAAEELGVRVAYLHTLNTNENMAIGKFEHNGVARHPGDTGMDNIAKLIYDELNVTLTENVTPAYLCPPTSISIVSSKNTTESDGEKLNLSIKTVPETETVSDVFWSVDNENIAVVDENGVFTSKNNGVVTVTAVSKADENVKASLEITVTGQTPCFTLTYDGGAEGVTGLPEANVYAKNNTILSSENPVREYYIFNGWTTEKGSDKTVGSVNVTENTTVYASWRKADHWTFDRDGYLDGMSVVNGFNVKVSGGVLQALATDTDAASGNVLKFVSQKLDIDSGNMKTFLLKIQNSSKDDSTQIKLTVTSTAGTYNYTKPVTTTEAATYTFDISDVDGIITGFEITPTNIDSGITVDEIAFCPGMITFDKNTTDDVSGIPEDMAATSGMTLPNKGISRFGYKFAGWSTQPDDISPVTYDRIHGNTTVYAVWETVGHWEFSDDHDFSCNGTGKVENGIFSHDFTGVNDPIINLKEFTFNAEDYTGVELRLSYTLDADKISTSTQVFFIPETQNGYSESASVQYYHRGNSSDGFVTFTVDMTGNSKWKGKIKELRIDAISGYGKYSLDYVRLIPKDEKKYSGGVIAVYPGEILNSSENRYGNVVVNGGTFKAENDAYVRNFIYESGNIDLSEGTLGSDMPTIAPNGKYKAADFGGLKESDRVVFSGNNNTIKNGKYAYYVLALDGDCEYALVTGDYTRSRLVKICSDGSVEMFKDNDSTLVTQNSAGIRSDEHTGLRLLANVSHSLRTIGKTEYFGELNEYGFVVGLESNFENSFPTLDDVAAKKAVSGVAYDKNGTDIVFEKHADYNVISCVLVNIPMEKQKLTAKLVMTPYITISDGGALHTVYGQSVAKSVYETAKQIITDSPDVYEQNKEYIDTVIRVCEN